MIDRTKIDHLRTMFGKLRTWIDSWHAMTMEAKMTTVVAIAVVALGLMFVAVVALLIS